MRILQWRGLSLLLGVAGCFAPTPAHWEKRCTAYSMQEAYQGEYQGYNIVYHKVYVQQCDRYDSTWVTP